MSSHRHPGPRHGRRRMSGTLLIDNTAVAILRRMLETLTQNNKLIMSISRYMLQMIYYDF